MPEFLDIKSLLTDAMREENQGDFSLTMIAIETLEDTIPKSALGFPFEYFMKFTPGEKPGLEISILTKDMVLVDAVISAENRHIIAMPLTPAVSILLETSYQPQDPTELRRAGLQPYRANLRIYSATTMDLTYTAEGNRRQVKSLITYGKKCLSVLHQVKGLA